MRCMLWQRLIRWKPRRRCHETPNHLLFPSLRSDSLQGHAECRIRPACDTWLILSFPFFPLPSDLVRLRLRVRLLCLTLPFSFTV